MRRLLFSDCGIDQQRKELMAYLQPTSASGIVGNSACFVAEADVGSGLVGFAEVMLRSHAEGCWDETSSGKLGVAYLEAWWVDPAARHRGCGRALVQACETWARAQGSTSLASDTQLDNQRSRTAHLALGFSEVERTIHFVKKL
jgi:aminoglycoside 6'-N-acetyltransferase I